MACCAGNVLMALVFVDHFERAEFFRNETPSTDAVALESPISLGADPAIGLLVLALGNPGASSGAPIEDSSLEAPWKTPDRHVGRRAVGTDPAQHLEDLDRTLIFKCHDLASDESRPTRQAPRKNTKITRGGTTLPGLGLRVVVWATTQGIFNLHSISNQPIPQVRTPPIARRGRPHLRATARARNSRRLEDIINQSV